MTKYLVSTPYGVHKDTNKVFGPISKTLALKLATELLSQNKKVTIQPDLKDWSKNGGLSF